MAFTYLIGWSEKDTWYYGYSSKDPSVLWKSYFTSSKYVSSFRGEFGEPDIVRVHKTFETKEAAHEYEGRFLKRVGAVKSPRWLNRHDGMRFMGPSEYTHESRQKMSIAASKRAHRPLSEETRRKISEAKRGKPGPKQSEETKRKRSESLKGRSLTEAHKQAISRANMGRARSEESKEKQRIAMKGRVTITEEGRKRISEAHKGKKRPLEWKLKISKSLRTRFSGNN